jgi:hypothetical protein
VKEASLPSYKYKLSEVRYGWESRNRAKEESHFRLVTRELRVKEQPSSIHERECWIREENKMVSETREVSFRRVRLMSVNTGLNNPRLDNPMHSWRTICGVREEEHRDTRQRMRVRGWRIPMET